MSAVSVRIRGAHAVPCAIRVRIKVAHVLVRPQAANRGRMKTKTRNPVRWVTRFRCTDSRIETRPLRPLKLRLYYFFFLAAAFASFLTVFVDFLLTLWVTLLVA